MKIICNLNFSIHNNILLEHSHAHSLAFCLLLLSQWPSWVVATKTIRPTKHKILFDPLQRKSANPCSKWNNFIISSDSMSSVDNSRLQHISYPGGQSWPTGQRFEVGYSPWDCRQAGWLCLPHRCSSSLLFECFSWIVTLSWELYYGSSLAFLLLSKNFSISYDSQDTLIPTLCILNTSYTFALFKEDKEDACSSISI